MCNVCSLTIYAFGGAAAKASKSINIEVSINLYSNEEREHTHRPEFPEMAPNKN